MEPPPLPPLPPLDPLVLQQLDFHALGWPLPTPDPAPGAAGRAAPTGAGLAAPSNEVGAEAGTPQMCSLQAFPQGMFFCRWSLKAPRELEGICGSPSHQICMCYLGAMYFWLANRRSNSGIVMLKNGV